MCHDLHVLQAISKLQMKDGNSLEAQEKQLKKNGAQEIFTDSFTGTKFNRPQLDLLLAKLKSEDTLIVTKLDRVARSLSQGSTLINDLLNKNIKVNILNKGIMVNTPSSKLIRNIFFSFAEFEREMIIERTQEGKAIAKEKEGFTEVRPKKFNKEQVDHALELLIDNSYKEVEKLTGISNSTLIRAKNKKSSRLMESK